MVCGSARTAEHNKVFLSGLMRTFEAAPEHLGNGRFSDEPAATLRAIGHIYAGWALRRFLAVPEFRWTAGSADDWRKPWPDWRPTRYEAKALKAGRGSVYLTFVRE